MQASQGYDRTLGLSGLVDRSSGRSTRLPEPDDRLLGHPAPTSMAGGRSGAYSNERCRLPPGLHAARPVLCAKS